jgi:hypothetical protein
MDYSNPFAFMTQNYGRPQSTYQQPQRMQIDPQQFRQFAITLNDTALNNFAQMARAQGISEQDIQRGIQFIKSL